MKDNTILLLAMIGAVVIVAFVIAVLMLLAEKWNDYRERKKYEYKRLHRFDRPPLAKCYCKDCIYGFKPYDEFGETAVKCSKENINHCADSWFCADGEPRVYDPEEEKNNDS